MYADDRLLIYKVKLGRQMTIVFVIHVLRSVDFWGRKCLKTARFDCVHCAVSPSPSGGTHAIPAPEIYTTDYVMGKPVL